MIRAKTTDNKIILGIDKENVKRLTSGKPILVKAESIDIEYDIIIAYGDTLQQLAKDLGLPRVQ